MSQVFVTQTLRVSYVYSPLQRGHGGIPSMRFLPLQRGGARGGSPWWWAVRPRIESSHALTRPVRWKECSSVCGEAALEVLRIPAEGCRRMHVRRLIACAVEPGRRALDNHNPLWMGVLINGLPPCFTCRDRYPHRPRVAESTHGGFKRPASLLHAEQTFSIADHLSPEKGPTAR